MVIIYHSSIVYTDFCQTENPKIKNPIPRTRNRKRNSSDLDSHHLMFALHHECPLRLTLFREWPILSPIEADCHRIDSERLESKGTRMIGCESMRPHTSNVGSHICIFMRYVYSVSYVFGCVNFFLWIYLSVSRTTSVGMLHLVKKWLPIWKKRIAKIQYNYS